ncbi:MAG: VWA domain-containing protein, partial [Planctomycetes bacterium]|nr:VWA domain-containing protein [Planctomycetota bacterium]
MVFLQPQFLWLLVLVPLVWVFPRGPRGGVQTILRTLALAACVFAIARPVREGADERAWVVWIDDRGGDLVARPTTLPSLEGARNRHLIVGSPREGDPKDSIRLPSSTSLGEALSVAERSIPKGSKGAIVLSSDGLSTATDWAQPLARLQERGLPLHTLSREIDLTRLRPVGLQALGELTVGQRGRVAIDVVGQGGSVVIRLSSEGRELVVSDARAVDGRRRFMLEVEPEHSGAWPLRAEILAGDDAGLVASLDTLVAVQEPLRVLYLGDRARGAAARLCALLGPGFEFESPALDAGFEDRLAEADLVVIDDLEARKFPDAMQQAVQAAVATDGLGIVCAGGNAAFGPGGYFESPLASIMPVDFVQKEEKRDPSTTLVVIVDTSGSMGGTRVQLAKEVARLAIQRLLPHDKVGVVEFYGAKRWAAPIQPASNTIDIQRALNRLDAGGGTVIMPAIEEAYYGLQNVDTRYKHVLVLTDGGVESGAFEPLLRKMAERGINVSSVLIGPEAHSEFLVNLANWGKGRFYAVPNRFNLPEIILKQPTSARLPAWREGRFALEARGSEVFWEGLDRRAVPPLAGYVETRAKEGAEVLLATEGGKHPILASWRFGLGRVTTLTTEPTGAGTATWEDWDGYGPLMARMLARTARLSRSPFAFELERRGSEVRLRARRLVREELSPQASLVVDDGDQRLAFHRQTPDRFIATFAHPVGDPILVSAGPERGLTTWLAAPAHGDRVAES